MKDLREFIKFLEEKNDLVRITKQVDRKYELGNIMRASCDVAGPALIFENISGNKIPVLGAVYGTRKRCLWALDSTNEKIHKDFTSGMKNPIPPITVKSGPCKEVIVTGEQINLDNFPVPWISPKDSGYFINLGVQIAKDPEFGRNLSIHRCQVLDKNKVGFQLPPSQHLEIFYSRAEEREEPLEVAIAMGVEPIISLSSQIKTPIGVDEIELAGGIKKQPIELVKCETIDVEVPSNSEIVIEGKLAPKIRKTEGPFGEYTGYYGKKTLGPVMEITAITTREDPIYHACSMPHENSFLKQIPHESALFDHVTKICPTVKAVHFPIGGGCTANAIISIKQTMKELAKSVIISAFGSGLRFKNVIIVDDDIDIFDSTKVDWALAFRCQPRDDVIILPKILSVGLDPSVVEENISSGMGIDATKPFGATYPEPMEMPESYKYREWFITHQ
jgi:UbiD family decarboxylase